MKILLGSILTAASLIACEGGGEPAEDRISQTPFRSERTEAEKLRDVEARLTALRDRVDEAMEQGSAGSDRLERFRRRLERDVEDIEDLLDEVRGSLRFRVRARMEMLEGRLARVAAQIRELRSRR